MDIKTYQKSGEIKFQSDTPVFDLEPIGDSLICGGCLSGTILVFNTQVRKKQRKKQHTHTSFKLLTQSNKNNQ